MVSTRRSQSDNGAYKIGDRVEIIRDTGIDTGILLGLATDENEGRESPSSANSGYSNHWLVSVDGEEEEVEVSPRYLGRVLSSTTRRKNAPRKGKNGAANAKTKVASAAPVASAKVTSAAVAPASKNNKSSKPNAAKAAAKESNSNDKPAKASGTKRQRGEVDDLLVCDVGEILKKKAKAPAPKVQQGETVKIIPMLTGKLYLFRGENPRAEFHWLV